jgi:hypothetical protein
LCDNEHDIVVVDVPNQIVFLIREDALEDGRVPAKFKPAKAWTFLACVESWGVAEEVEA